MHVADSYMSTAALNRQPDGILTCLCAITHHDLQSRLMGGLSRSGLHLGISGYCKDQHMLVSYSVH